MRSSFKFLKLNRYINRMARKILKNVRKGKIKNTYFKNQVSYFVMQVNYSDVDKWSIRWWFNEIEYYEIPEL